MRVDAFGLRTGDRFGFAGEHVFDLQAVTAESDDPDYERELSEIREKE